MSIDRSLHSLFGASKVAADVLVQEYGRYFGMRTACFRGGTLTGPGHSATELHGFLAYVMRCAMTGTPVHACFGYKGKQVRDAIHSQRPRSRPSTRSSSTPRRRGLQHRRRPLQQLLGARGDRPGRGDRRPAARLDLRRTGNRIGDHIWWIGDNGRFQSHYPGWRAGVRRRPRSSRRSTRPTASGGRR